jgi:hypothetical protein
MSSNLVEVAVAGFEDHALTFRSSGNPDVILRKWASFLLEASLQASVFTGNIDIARDNGSAGSG